MQVSIDGVLLHNLSCTLLLSGLNPARAFYYSPFTSQLPINFKC